mmetsp:Transcript_28063/g.48922  ORF Transcript_28063/g.48922 Transcript_28063/m.48922 type:complete len:86 (-) Transcript_28063:1138-1395(-)
MEKKPINKCVRKLTGAACPVVWEVANGKLSMEVLEVLRTYYDFAMHAMNPVVSSSLFKFLPMKTILHLFSSSAFHAPSIELANNM